MKHPLEFFPQNLRKPFFLTFLFLTLVLFAVFAILDQPLRTDLTPYGIVSFELARTPQFAQSIIDLWSGRAMTYAAFGLGLDYLFMPVYALALSFATLLVAQKHLGWIRTLAVIACYGAFAAALFDAVENYSLFQVLLGNIESGYPQLAAICATVKFSLLIFGILVVLMGWSAKERSV